MIPSIRLVSCLMASVALAACANQAATPEQAVTAATPTQASMTAPSHAASEAAFALSMDKVNAYFQAQRKLGEASLTDASLGDMAMNLSEEDATKYAARLEANAKTRVLIAQSGLTPREFALTGQTLMAALMTQGALEAGQLETIPEGIDPASVEFVKQRKAQIEELIKSMQVSDGT